MTDFAVSAIAANQPAAAEFPEVSLEALKLSHHAVGLLDKSGQAPTVRHRSASPTQSLFKQPFGFKLCQRQRPIGQPCARNLHRLNRFAIAEDRNARQPDTRVDRLFHKTEILKNLQRPSCHAERLAEKRALSHLLDEQDINAVATQLRCQHQAHRARSNNQDLRGGLHLPHRVLRIVLRIVPALDITTNSGEGRLSNALPHYSILFSLTQSRTVPARMAADQRFRWRRAAPGT